MAIQLRAFGPNLIKSACLPAKESPRQAFYILWIEPAKSGFRVCKESGGLGKVWQRGIWEFESLEKAEALFDRRIREKTNPARKSKRVYKIVNTGMQTMAWRPESSEEIRS